MHTLKAYLESLPPDLADLYEHMWLKNNENLVQHRREAAMLFELAIIRDDALRPTRRAQFGLNVF